MILIRYYCVLSIFLEGFTQQYNIGKKTLDTDLYMHSFRESIFRAVIETLQLPSGSRGLDADILGWKPV